MSSPAKNEALYYEVLYSIANGYDSPATLRKLAESRYGLSYEECLEMAYENIKAEARSVIKSKRKPK